MKLFKVTYEKICDPSEGIFLKEYQAYYMSNSLDRLYDYVENKQHLTVKNIQILNCTIVNQETHQDINKEQMQSLGDFVNDNIAKVI